MMREVAFDPARERCAAWHFSATSHTLAGLAGRPCVVMAHGFGGTRDTGLTGYAEGFADAGLDVLPFDYRGFDASSGMPRRLRRRPRSAHRADRRGRRVHCGHGQRPGSGRVPRDRGPVVDERGLRALCARPTT